jgi:hypothetical protein
VHRIKKLKKAVKVHRAIEREKRERERPVPDSDSSERFLTEIRQTDVVQKQFNV